MVCTHLGLGAAAAATATATAAAAAAAAAAAVAVAVAARRVELRPVARERYSERGRCGGPSSGCSFLRGVMDLHQARVAQPHQSVIILCLR